MQNNVIINIKFLLKLFKYILMCFLLIKVYFLLKTIQVIKILLEKFTKHIIFYFSKIKKTFLLNQRI